MFWWTSSFSCSFIQAFNRVACWDRFYLSCNNPWLSAPFRTLARGSGSHMVGLRVKNVLIDTKVWNKVVFLPWILILLELSWSSSLGFAFNGVACWNRFLSKLNLVYSFFGFIMNCPKWSSYFRSSSSCFAFK